MSNLPPYDHEILTSVHAHALHEQARCEALACDVGATDSQLSDECWFDAGVLAACQCITVALLRGDDVLAIVQSLTRSTAALNDEREC